MICCVTLLFGCGTSVFRKQTILVHSVFLEQCPVLSTILFERNKSNFLHVIGACCGPNLSSLKNSNFLVLDSIRITYLCNFDSSNQIQYIYKFKHSTYML